jgi:recombination protein RecA
MLIAEAQKNGKLALYINQEGTFDKGRAILHGVDLDGLVIAGPFETAEQAMDTLIDACKAKVVDLIVLDSIQAMSPKGEQETKKGKEKSIEDDEMALLARKLSKFFRVSTSGVYKGDVTVILIGQTRVGLGGFIALDELSGGKALKHWSTITLHLRRGAKSEAPTEKVELEELDEEGKKIKVELVRGFQSIIKLEKVKISGTLSETSEIRIPFYFVSGYRKVENEPVSN